MIKNKHDLSVLSKELLLKNTEALAKEERRITSELIAHLREVERRMLFLELGYGSLFEFACRHLGLSEGSAHRRISAMRLVRDLPEVAGKIESGALSLSNASKLQVSFKACEAKRDSKAPLTKEKKREVLKAVEFRSQNECQKKLYEMIPLVKEIDQKERVRKVSADQTEVRFVITSDLQEKIDRLKALMSHQVPNGSTLELFEKLVDQEIKRQEKKKGLNETPAKSTPEASQELDRSILVDPATGRPEHSELSLVLIQKRRAIPQCLQREVWRAAKGKCQYPDCQSRYQLQIDHKIPVALGGTNERSNLRLLCRLHNMHQARKQLGAATMRKHLKWSG